MRVESKSKLLIQPNNMRSSDVGIKVIEKRNVNHTALASGEGPESSLGVTVIGGRSSVQAPSRQSLRERINIPSSTAIVNPHSLKSQSSADDDNVNLAGNSIKGDQTAQNVKRIEIQSQEDLLV